MRAPMQVLVIPFQATDAGLRVGVLHRADMDVWQFIAGGAEDDEMPVQAARREAWEEAGISPKVALYALESRCCVPSGIFAKDAPRWGARCLVVPEFSFAVAAKPEDIRLSGEHTAVEWLDEAAAAARLRYDSNRTALWELGERLRRGLLDEVLTEE